MLHELPLFLTDDRESEFGLGMHANCVAVPVLDNQLRVSRLTEIGFTINHGLFSKGRDPLTPPFGG